MRSLRMESLENRELMAADVTAALSAGTLQVTGTDKADIVRINQGRNTISVSVGLNSPFASFAANEVRNLRINMNGGNDKVYVNLQQAALDSIFVDMGRGVNEGMDLRLGSVGTMNIDAVASLHTNASISGTINGTASVDFGSGAGDDVLTVWNSSARSLNVKMGGGDDRCVLTRSQVDRAMIDLGAGDDNLSNNTSDVLGGTINGGSAVRGNKWFGKRFGKAVSVKGF